MNTKRITTEIAQAADAIRAGQPFLFGRCGATEMRTVAEYLTGKYTEKTRGEINTLSGVFPTDDKALNRFCKLYTSCAQGRTCWRCGMWGPSGR